MCKSAQLIKVFVNFIKNLRKIIHREVVKQLRKLLMICNWNPTVNCKIYTTRERSFLG